MSHFVRTWLLLLSLGAAVFAVGCAQEEGELCDTDDNCVEGLECACGQIQDGVTIRRGICAEPGSIPACMPIPMPTRDAGPVQDAGPTDAGPEADAGPDGMDAGADAGPAAIDAGTDGGPADAGSDAGPDDSGVTDAA